MTPPATAEVVAMASTMLYDEAYATRCRAYGLSPALAAKMYLAQGKACGICQSQRHYSELVPDHHHRTGTVRGLLCNRCNTAIGMFEDNLWLVRRAAEYLTAAGVAADRRRPVTTEEATTLLAEFDPAVPGASIRRRVHAAALRLGQACPACAEGQCASNNTPLVRKFDPRRRSAVTRKGIRR